MPIDVLGALALVVLIAALLGVGFWACHRTPTEMSEQGKRTLDVLNEHIEEQERDA